ncbi:MAG: tetratricopeptide repeat protein [Acidobacteriota bacterium]|nr:tetratricopeptide repeat protein [Acidobacteriota bacterium]MDH3528049.1 tetratricopeptide repeat protein [Acidobacteriota bacterium]
MKKVITICFALLVLASAGLSQTGQPPEIVAATELLQQEKYDEAETGLARFLKDNPQNARAFYLLASARHGKGDYKGAAEALKKNLAINQNWPAMYNLASAYARLGDKGAAFEWLKKALTNGAAFSVSIETDEDLSGLRDDPAFKEMLSIVDKQRNPCKYSEKAHEFDFWLGDWDVFVNGRKIGENLIERGVNGCTLIENWKNTGGGTGKSLNVYDASVDKWKQFYVGSQGGVFLFEGGREGNMMKFTAETVNAAGAKTLHKFEFTDLPDKTVRQKWDTSTDGGKTYTTVWDSIYKRKNSGVGNQDSEGKEDS